MSQYVQNSKNCSAAGKRVMVREAASNVTERVVCDVLYQSLMARRHALREGNPRASVAVLRSAAEESTYAPADDSLTVLAQVGG
jgi:hypothetical protein